MNRSGNDVTVEKILCDLEKIRASADNAQVIGSIRIAAQAVLYAFSREQRKAFEIFIAALDNDLSEEQERSLSLHGLEPRIDPK
ncbi:MAG TPA: hypothetical protein VFW23_09095 [Tepidisphaeraceae bacterium]|nr:hypothetical protein [Tepidisphaeraceae bacterium]